MVAIGSFAVDKSKIVYGMSKNMCIEKVEFGWDKTFVDFPKNIRLRIVEGNITEYLSFNLTFVEEHSALYNGVVIKDEELIILPTMPDELK